MRAICSYLSIAAAGLLLAPAAQAQLVGAPSNVTVQHLVQVPFPDSFFTAALTNLVSADRPNDPISLAELQKSIERAKAHIGEAREALAEATSGGGALNDVHALVEELHEGVQGEPVADDLAEMLTGAESGGHYTQTFHFSKSAPPIRQGEIRDYPANPFLRYSPDPAVDQILVVDFVPRYDAGSYFLLLIRRPDNIPSDFGLAGVNVIQAAVPEPATWAMMIVGLGAVGTIKRRHQVRVSFA